MLRKVIYVRAADEGSYPLPGPFSDAGRAQAQELGVKLGKMARWIYTSPLEHARATAEVIKRYARPHVSLRIVSELQPRLKFETDEALHKRSSYAVFCALTGNVEDVDKELPIIIVTNQEIIKSLTGESVEKGQYISEEYQVNGLKTDEECLAEMVGNFDKKHGGEG